MRPLSVTMQAFGPYAGVQKLDFADLHGAGFFLITGPTGAGKTTVLDAMSFALYGETSGGGDKDGARSGAAMRSDHADPGTRTRVVFDFSLGANLYRIERVPEQERPKLRGEGTTTQLQEATMWRLRRDASDALEPDGAPLAAGWSRVGAKAEDILGFRAEQFRQVVMLPQGRFQQFLEADSSQREQILRALFDTGHYADIERALHDEALALKRASERVVTQREEVLRAAEAASVDDLDERCARLAVDAIDAGAHADEADALDKEAQRALSEGRDAARRLKERVEAAAEVAALATRDDEVRAVRDELEAARRAASVADMARQARDTRAHLETTREALTAATDNVDAAAAVLVAAQAALDVEVSRAADRDHADEEARRLKGFAGGAGALAEAREALGRATETLESARAAAAAAAAARTEAGDDLATLETAWAHAQAGLLARALRDGEPCPVCGGLDHPAPADLPAAAPSEDDVEAARRVLAGAQARHDEASTALTKAHASHAAAQALSDERATGVPAEFADPATLAAAIETAQGAAAKLTEAFELAQRTCREAEVKASGLRATHKAAVESLAKAKARAASATERLAARLQEAGFTDEPQRAAAARPADVVTALAELVAGHEQATFTAAARARLADEAAAGVESPHLDGLEEAAAAAGAAAAKARDDAAALKAAAGTAGKQLARLRQLEEAAADDAARYEVIGRLADVAGGRNGRRLSFQSYVLGAFLDDVLVTASERLRTMSKHRYSLERTEERSGRKQAAGLDLVAYDAWTGVPRPVSTLSGGEKFLAALSLALGLAEVVQAHAGGIRLETVFVDEGFGSLDDEALDLAVDALMALNQSGRLVGVISHVSELRERIDARLEVVADRDGSTARFVVP